MIEEVEQNGSGLFQGAVHNLSSWIRARGSDLEPDSVLVSSGPKLGSYLFLAVWPGFGFRVILRARGSESVNTYTWTIVGAQGSAPFCLLSFGSPFLVSTLDLACATSS